MSRERPKRGTLPPAQEVRKLEIMFSTLSFVLEIQKKIESFFHVYSKFENLLIQQILMGFSILVLKFSRISRIRDSDSPFSLLFRKL